MPLQGGVSEQAYYPQLTAQYPGAFGQQLSAAAQDLILRGIAPLTGSVSQGGSAPGVNVGGSNATATGGNASSSSNSSAIANLYESPDGAGSAQQSSPRNPIQFPTINYPQASPSAYSPLSPIPTSAPNFGGGGSGGGGVASTSPQAPSFGGGPVGQPFAAPQSQPVGGFSVSGGEPSQGGGTPMLQGGVSYNQPGPGGQPPMANAPWGQQLGQLAQGAYDYAQPMIQGAGDMLSNLGESLGNAFMPAAQAKGQQNNSGLVPPPKPYPVPNAPPTNGQPPPPPGMADVAAGAAHYADEIAPQAEDALNKLAQRMASQVVASARSMNQIEKSMEQQGEAMTEALHDYATKLLRPFETPLATGRSVPGGIQQGEAMSVMDYRDLMHTQVTNLNAHVNHLINEDPIQDFDKPAMVRALEEADRDARRGQAAVSTSRDPGHKRVADTYAEPGARWNKAVQAVLQGNAEKVKQLQGESERLSKQIEQIDVSKARVDRQIMETSASAAKTYYDAVQLKLDAEAKKGNLAAQVMGNVVAQKRADLQLAATEAATNVVRAQLKQSIAKMDKESNLAIAKLTQEMAKVETSQKIEVQKLELQKVQAEVARQRALMEAVTGLMKNSGGTMTYDQAVKAAEAMAKGSRIDTVKP